MCSDVRIETEIVGMRFISSIDRHLFRPVSAYLVIEPVVMMQQFISFVLFQWFHYQWKCTNQAQTIPKHRGHQLWHASAICDVIGYTNKN